MNGDRLRSRPLLENGVKFLCISQVCGVVSVVLKVCVALCLICVYGFLSMYLHVWCVCVAVYYICVHAWVVCGW